MIASLWRRPSLALVIAGLVLAAMYVANPNMGIAPGVPRGDGRHLPIFAAGDGHMLFLMTRSTVLDGDWNWDDDLARFGDPWTQPVSAAGRKGIPHPIGPALVWSPFFALVHGAAKVANLFGAGIESHGYTAFHQRALFSTSVAFAVLAVALAWRVAKRLFGDGWAASLGAAVVLLGTSLTYYGAIMASYGHAMDAFFCSAFLAVWATSVGRKDLGRYVWLGLLLGLAALVRTQELALGVVLALEIAISLGRLALAGERPRGERAREALGELGRGALALAVALLAFIPQLAMWKIVYGTYHLPHGSAYTRWGTPMIAELLFSARNGWFTTTPVAYLGVLGLLLVPRRAPVVGWGLLAAVAAQLYLNGIIMDWWGQSSFGARRLCSVTLPLVVGLALLFARGAELARGWRKLARWLGHGVAYAALAQLSWWNLRSAWALRGSKAAPTLHAPSCCTRVPRWVRPLATSAYGLAGNPFGFPANAWFAVVHRTSLSRWDQAVGDYPIILDGNLMVAGRWRTQKGRWNLGAPSGEPYVLEGLGPSERGDREFRRTTAPRARALVPNLIPAAQRYAVWLRPRERARARVLFEESLVRELELAPGWQAVTFDVARPPVGSNELWLETDTSLDLASIDVSFLPE